MKMSEKKKWERQEKLNDKIIKKEKRKWKRENNKEYKIKIWKWLICFTKINFNCLSDIYGCCKRSSISS
jgi:hypothetical protein